MRLAAPILRVLARALLASCRIQRIEGASHLERLISQGQPLLACCWHQRLSVCVGHLLRAREQGLEPGFLVSPSRDGELVARMVSGMGARIVRGSANRTGAKALRDMYTTMREGVSPILHPDGPHGPARQVKPGSIMLAQLTRSPLLPMSFAADRYWQLGSWDALIIPKPFARVVITIGEPLTVARGDDIDQRARELGQRLDGLTDTADAELGANPRRERRRSG
ncbi:hypothetical protein T31B1_05435 [Salinisphaera sp. T31B1]